MKTLRVTWIVVADSHKALLFKKTSQKNSKVLLVHTLEAHLNHNHATPGRSFNSTGNLRHAMEPHTDPRDLEKKNFAHEITEMLTDVFRHSTLDNLVLIAPPKLLGMLDKDLDKQVHKKLTHKLSKDIVDKKIEEIEDYIDEVLKQE